MSNQGRADATQFRDFSRALKGVFVDATCEIADPRIVSCVLFASDDLGIAIGSDPYTERWDISFNNSEITQIVRTQTDEDEAFFDWAFSTYPNICDTPAQCALALLDIAGEYTQLS